MSSANQISSGPGPGPLILGKYAPIRRVAVGGMAELYLARQRGVAGFDRLMMLKRLLPELSAKPDFVRQFLDEARVVATLSHPSIVSILEVGEHEGDYFIAMELIRGITLSQRLAFDRVVPLAVAARLVRDAALGLHYAHQATDPDGRALQIVHRDVSPSNLMVDERGALKIVDFGIAHAAGRLTKTQAGTVKGKWGYMPLEQLAGGQVDARCDQFALGVVCWELLTSRRLFPDRNMVKLVSDRAVAPPSSLRPEVPAELDAIVLRMLAEEAADRFATCADVGQALDALLVHDPKYSETSVAQDCGGLIEKHVAALTTDLSTQADALAEPAQISPAGPGGTVDLNPPAATTTQLPPRPPRRSWTGRLAALAAVLVMGGVAGFWWWSQPPSTAGGPAEVEEHTPTAELGQTPSEPTPPEPRPLEVAGEPAAASRTTPPRRKATRRKARRQPATSAKSGGHGWLNVDTQPWSEVWVDGKFVGTTPVYRLRLAAGSHRLKFVNKKQGLQKRKTLRIEPNKSLKLIEQLQ